jgi:hypothetical protein
MLDEVADGAKGETLMPATIHASTNNFLTACSLQKRPREEPGRGAISKMCAWAHTP